MTVMWWLRGAAMAAILLCSTGCGYSLAGRGTFLPSYITTIGVPLFTNQTTVIELDESLTQKVRAELVGRGHYTVVPEARGDAILLGEVTNVTLVPVAFNADRQASRYAVGVTIKLEFRDVKADSVLWENPSFVVTEQYDVATPTIGNADAAAFLGQESTAVDRLSSRFARDAVSAILEAF
jgi:hypothetical protein